MGIKIKTVPVDRGFIPDKSVHKVLTPPSEDVKKVLDAPQEDIQKVLEEPTEDMKKKKFKKEDKE